MSLRLITGGCGAGKTEYLYRSVIQMSLEEPEGRFFLIAPEQSTMQAQKELIRLHPRHGTMNIDVVSFERLAYRIFSELSLPQPEILDDTGKTMILRRLAGEKKNELILFASHLNQNGFIDEVKSMLSELYQYGVTPEQMKEQLGKSGVSRILERKLLDMEILYRAFREFTKERYITMEELLDVLCAHAGRSKLLKGSIIALDGYTGFTPIQYRLLGILMTMCRDMYVTVTATEGTDFSEAARESDLFDMSRKMREKLRRLAADNNVAVERDLVLGTRPLPRFKESPALDYLEATMFRYPYTPWKGKTDELRLVQAENPADEVRFVANRICQLVRKEGCRYRDIALVCGDLPGYAKELIHQFEENAIPLFVDEKRDVSGNPMLRLMKSLIDILHQGFDYESMFQYLRTGLVSEDREKIDRLETYVRAMGIRGFKRWDAPWERTFEGGRRINLVELNEFREEIMGPLRAFKEEAGDRGTTVGEITRALAKTLETLEIERKLQEKSEEFRSLGMDLFAREYSEIYGLVVKLLDRLYELLGTETVGKREYLEILKAGLSELSVGMIPASADRVVAGDLKRTRLDKVRYLFFLGVNEGVVPADLGRGGILTEQERETLKQNELELAPTAREEGFMQRFYLYLMMTKPSRCLTVSWTTLSAEGKTMRPSSLVGQLKKRFPALSVENAEDLRDKTVTMIAARAAVVEWMQEPDRMMARPELAAVYRALFAQPEMKEEMERLAAACVYAYKEKGIGEAAALELYGSLMSGSVTRLEGYAGCAFSHFLQHGLELRKRQEYELDLSDMGNLFHQSLDLFFRQVKEQGMDFRTISESERKKLVKQCVAEVADEYRNTIMKSSARNAYLERKVERITDRTIRALIYQIQKGDFEPTGFEVDVSTRIPLKNGAAMNLRGRIDRMDVLEEKDQVFVKIMDYKSGSTSFDLSLIYHGLQLQLVVYMDAALALEEKRHPGKKAVPAGIFYYHIADPMLERGQEIDDEEVEAGILKKLRMDGLASSRLDVIRHMDREAADDSDVIPVAFNSGGNEINRSRSSVADGARFSALSDFVRNHLVRMGEEILDGNTAVNPYKQGQKTACDYCPYHSVCGFDLKTYGYGYRRFLPMKAKTVWAKIEGREDEDQKKDGEKEWRE